MAFFQKKKKSIQHKIGKYENVHFPCKLLDQSVIHQFGLPDLLLVNLLTIEISKLSKIIIMKISKKQNYEISSGLKYSCILNDYLNT